MPVESLQHSHREMVDRFSCADQTARDWLRGSGYSSLLSHSSIIVVSISGESIDGYLRLKSKKLRSKSTHVLRKFDADRYFFPAAKESEVVSEIVVSMIDLALRRASAWSEPHGIVTWRDVPEYLSVMLGIVGFERDARHQLWAVRLPYSDSPIEAQAIRRS